jgi:hypothetical protein
MDTIPLVIDRIEAGARFLGEFQKYVPVQVAFWLKESSAMDWYLYVASERITAKNFHLAYREVGRITDQIRDPWFDPMRVKVIGVDDPLVPLALDIQRRYPGRSPTYFDGKMVRGLGVDAIYSYPSPIPVPA